MNQHFLGRPVSCALLLSAAFVASSASAETSGASGWFAELRYQNSFSEGATLSDSGTGNLNVASTVGTKWKSLDSIGGAVGYQYSNGATAFSLGYDNMGTSTYRATSFTNRAGTTFSNVNLPVETTNLMLELTHKIPINENFYGIAILGVGQAKHNSKPFTATGVSNAGVGQSVSVTSTRFGFGVGYKLSDTVELISAVQMSDYGDAKLRASASTTPTKLEVSATEASIRLRYAF
jgi:opacity protein-like surface antigen